MTDGTQTFAIFLYQCGLLQSSSAAIGYWAAGNFSQSHRLSLLPASSDISCASTSDSQWNSLLYPIHYDGQSVCVCVCVCVCVSVCVCVCVCPSTQPVVSSLTGVRAVILPTPEGPVYRAAVYIDLRCKVITPGNYNFSWEAYCLASGTRVFHAGNFTDISHLVSFSSTPDSCLDLIVCRAWDENGSMAEDKFRTGNITGQ